MYLDQFKQTNTKETKLFTSPVPVYPKAVIPSRRWVVFLLHLSKLNISFQHLQYFLTLELVICVQHIKCVSYFTMDAWEYTTATRH